MSLGERMKKGERKRFDRPEYFINRELSWLKFNERVLEEACEKEHPLFERLKFLAITASNLDEFFMVRVAGLKQQMHAPHPIIDNKTQMTATEQYTAVMQEARRFVQKQMAVYNDVLTPLLEQEGIVFRRPKDLTREEREALEEWFWDTVYPVLTPMAVDASRPFPVLANRSLNLALLIEPEMSLHSAHAPGEPLFAFVQVPHLLPRAVRIDVGLKASSRKTGTLSDRAHSSDRAHDGAFDETQADDLQSVDRVDSMHTEIEERRDISQGTEALAEEVTQPIHTYILLEDVIRMFIHHLFRGQKIVAVAAFRITRNSDLLLNEFEAEDLLEEIERELKKRRMSDAVRIEIEPGMHPFLRSVLQEWEEVGDEAFFEMDGPIDLTFLMRFINEHDYEHLLYTPIPPMRPIDLIGEDDIFDAMKKKDLLFYHPYESFDPVVRFIEDAADDPHVLAIKQTLYRVGKDSPIVHALMRAAEAGKQVTVVVELRARFDEEKNIEWAKQLEEAGCHVIYGLVGLKTHAKMVLVVRREADGLRRYVHLGTGNYNPQTARLYTDLSFLTSDEKIAEDVAEIFNSLSGYSTLPDLSEVRVGPHHLREMFHALIEEVIHHSRPDRPGRIIAKINALTDKEIILDLYRASQHGVKVDLIVRGISCLRPKVPGVSDNIRVVSIVGRYLEHSRIFVFQSHRREKVFIGSADWMTRNIERRVETIFPIRDRMLKKRLIRFLDLYLHDNINARELLPDGSYVRITREGHEAEVDAQMDMYTLLRDEAKRIKRRVR
ncbi:MAG: polyphosphate kinase 1 [Candidatus Carbobacillus sp.]|nr:polyphosphate kinase 1 [Candidatus Carbobacillus sp.]